MKRILFSISSAFFLILSFPNFNIWFLAWIGLVPLFSAIENQKPIRAFLISYLVGVLFFLGTMYWLIHVTLPGMIFTALYLALYFGFFGLFTAYSLQLTAYGLIFLAPAAWVVLEWIRSNGILGLGWALLGHSQSYNLPAIQIADIFGAYGVSFLIVMVNTAIYLTIKGFGTRKTIISVPLVMTSLAVFATLAYGQFRLNNMFTGEKLKVSVVQANIAQENKWEPEFREAILAKYENLTKATARENPDLIVWPEASVPGFLESERDLFERVKALAVEVKKPLLIGTVREELKGGKEVYYNSAVLFSEDGRIVDRYNKIHLVPFGEYVPFKKIFSFVEKFAPVPIGDCAAGTEYKVFNFFIERSSNDKDFNWRLLKKAHFSVLICFEDIFPELARRFVKNGAGFLVNITNDAWYKKTSAAYQHSQSSAFRAVENRINVVRAANTGLSCFIDQKGKISNAVERGGERLFVDGFETHEITLSRTRTFYMLFGDCFIYILIGIITVYIMIRLSAQFKI